LDLCWNKVNLDFTKNDEFDEIKKLVLGKIDSNLLPSESSTSHGTNYFEALEENEYLKKELKMKNAELKRIIDSYRSLIWDINTMLSSSRG